jgi:DNA polymerase-3 subunit beta
LACISRKCVPEAVSFKATIPSGILVDVAHLASKYGGDTQVSITENKAAFRIGKTTVVTRLIGGDFPEYTHIIPTKFVTKFTVAASSLMDVTKRASICAADKIPRVTFEVSENLLKVKSLGQTMEFDDEIAVDGGETKVEVSFNSDYFMQGLKPLAGKMVEVCFSGATTPALMRPVNDTDYASVVMPMR